MIDSMAGCNKGKGCITAGAQGTGAGAAFRTRARGRVGRAHAKDSCHRERPSSAAGGRGGGGVLHPSGSLTSKYSAKRIAPEGVLVHSHSSGKCP